MAPVEIELLDELMHETKYQWHFVASKPVTQGGKAVVFEPGEVTAGSEPIPTVLSVKECYRIFRTRINGKRVTLHRAMQYEHPEWVANIRTVMDTADRHHHPKGQFMQPGAKPSDPHIKDAPPSHSDSYYVPPQVTLWCWYTEEKSNRQGLKTNAKG